MIGEFTEKLAECTSKLK